MEFEKNELAKLIMQCQTVLLKNCVRGSPCLSTGMLLVECLCVKTTLCLMQ